MTAPLWVKIFVCFSAALLAVGLVLSVKLRRWATPWGPVTPDNRPFLFWIGIGALAVMFVLFLAFAIGLIVLNDT